MIRIRSKSSLVDLEQVSQSIDDLSERTDLFLPRNLSYGGAFGISIALSQVVAKWARSEHAGSLRVNTKPDSESVYSVYKELANYPHGLISMFMAMEHTDGNNNSSRENVLKQGAEKVEAMNSYRLQETQKGLGAFLACFSGMRNEFVKPFYSQATIDGGLRSTSDFRSLTRMLLEAADKRFAKNTAEDVIDPLSSLVFELIENTNDHGTKNLGGAEFGYRNPNVRGLLVRKVSVNPDQKIHSLRSDRRTSSWTTRALFKGLKRSQIRLELSVFDFGPGIVGAKQLAEKKPQCLEGVLFKEEESMVRAAFRKGITTKLKSGTGIGLDTAIRCLSDLGAAMRLRTGRICYWQDFTKSSNEFDPVHFLEKQPQLPEVPGTVYTLLIPL